jgi:hypothetical protein
LKKKKEDIIFIKTKGFDDPIIRNQNTPRKMQEKTINKSKKEIVNRIKLN